MAILRVPWFRGIGGRGKPVPDSGVLYRATGLLLPSALLFFTACKVGPDYEQPPAEFPSNWTAPVPGELNRISPEESPDLEWWGHLGDEALNTLIRRAVETNRDLEQAQARVRQARSLVGVAESRLLPRLGTSGSFDRIEFSENFPVIDRFLSSGQVSPTQDLYSAIFDAGWEIDIFGGVRRGVEAAGARLEATEAGRREVLLTVVAEVAKTYFELRRNQEQAVALRRNIDLQKEVVELSRAQLDSGTGTRLDLERALAQLSALEARLPPVLAGEAGAAYRLAVLTSQQPAEVYREFSEPEALPAPPDLVPVGLPGEMLKRRPDVARAERQLAAATAEVGVNVAALYPRFSLTGLAGWQGQSFTELFDAESGTWAIGGGIRWPVFQAGRLRSAVDAAEANREIVYQQYQMTILEAVAEAEGALTRYARAFESRNKLEDSLAHQQEAVQLARDAFDAGVVSFFEVLEVQRRLADTEQRLASSRAEVLLALAALNKALGGGWSDTRIIESTD